MIARRGDGLVTHRKRPGKAFFSTGNRRKRFARGGAVRQDRCAVRGVIRMPEKLQHLATVIVLGVGPIAVLRSHQFVWAVGEAVLPPLDFLGYVSSLR